MRMNRTSILLTAVCLTMSGITASSQDFEKVQIMTSHVAGRVYMLTGAGGNIGVSVGEDGILMVDDQFMPLAEKIRAALQYLNSGKLTFLLNTHYHGDHVGGNEVFGSEATIIAHDNVRTRLMTEQTRAGNVTPPRPKEAWPVISFSESVSVHFNGEEIRLVHMPAAHTDGDAAVWFTGSNVVHLGDLFFNGMFPYVDIDAGGNPFQLTGHIAEILKELPDDAKVIPGHGPLGSVEDLRSYHRMLSETIATVRQQKESGKSLKEIKAAGLGDEWKEWSWSFITTEKWIETVYSSLK